uniref:Uncharacterized protein n=1 Tax=Glossina palpalis gambiensis TaxID=67801 RepID=A0A1B0BJW9_9MUSC
MNRSKCGTCFHRRSVDFTQLIHNLFPRDSCRKYNTIYKNTVYTHLLTHIHVIILVWLTNSKRLKLHNSQRFYCVSYQDVVDNQMRVNPVPSDHCLFIGILCYFSITLVSFTAFGYTSGNLKIVKVYQR